LLLLDWDYRACGGETPQAGEYRSRFPGDESLVDDVAREAAVAANSEGNTSALQVLGKTLHDASPDTCVPVNPPSEGSESPSERYELIEQIGSGGIGVVYRANDHHLGRELAIKLLREPYRKLPEAVGRFLTEAHVGSQLQHPAIVPVYELGRWRDGSPLLTMKLVEGQTLRELLKARTNSSEDLPQMLDVFEQVCQALAYAHAQGTKGQQNAAPSVAIEL
jgi:serine/threonine protein kinase